jgi:hypothetical protein
MSGPLHLKVFISSPGDVQDERNLARQLIKDELPYDPFLRDRVTLEAVTWDDPVAGAPMLATLNPQQAVNRGLPTPAQCDITVVVLWSRLGSPLPDTIRKANGQLDGSKNLAVWRRWRLNAATPTGNAHGGSAGFLRPRESAGAAVGQG